MAQNLSPLSVVNATTTLETHFQWFARILSITVADYGLAPTQSVACNNAGHKS